MTEKSQEKWVVSPTAMIKWAGGEIVVGTSDVAYSFVTTEMQVLNVLNAFSEPASESEVVSDFNELGAENVQKIIILLKRVGALIQPSDGPKKATAGRASQIVRGMAVQLREVSGNIAGFGDHLNKISETGVNALDVLERLSGGLTGLNEELKRFRKSYLASQIEKHAATLSRSPVKVHIGAGPHPLDGWINIDVSPAPFSMDARWGLPFGANSCDFIFSSHMLEHLYYGDEVRAHLKDVFDTLKKGGVFRMIVPDIEKYIKAYAEDDREFYESQKKVWPWARECKTKLEHFLAYAGAHQLIEEYLSHKYAYDFETLEFVLREAGFKKIIQSSYMASSHPELKVDFASEVSAAKFGDQYFSLFVEAVK
jgi:predicted SAM-dependent methyltransferase